MIVVFDTSGISAFILADELDALMKILKGHEIAITEQVRRELHLSKKERLRGFEHLEIKVIGAESSIADKYSIHIGEASVIMGVKKLGDNGLAVIDDKKARRAADNEAIEFIGTATLLKLGIEKKILTPEQAESIAAAGKLYLSQEIRRWMRV